MNWHVDPEGELVTCPRCGGTRNDPDVPERECRMCKGKGRVHEDYAGANLSGESIESVPRQ